MRVHNSTRYAAIAALVGGLACASNKARTAETTPDQAAAARDTTTTSRDTTRAQTENPPGYRGMERDTTLVPRTGQTPSDTFLQRQGQGTPQDTAGYSGIERDTTHRARAADSTGYGRDSTGYGRDTTRARSSRDTSGTPADSSSWKKSSATGLDTTGMSRTGDTTGYHPTQQARDSSAR